jgi:hypothetical protein
MPSSSFLQHNSRSLESSYGFESRTANPSYPAKVGSCTSAIAEAMASLFELSAGGSDGDASGGSKSCRSVKTPSAARY